MRWTWDVKKNAINKQKHGLSFETAILVFDDPLSASRRDTYPLEERWQTIGMVGNTVILIVHKVIEKGDIFSEEVTRIISARKATAYERRCYENGEF